MERPRHAELKLVATHLVNTDTCKTFLNIIHELHYNKNISVNKIMFGL